MWQVATGIGMLMQLGLVADSWLNLRALRRRGRNGPAKIVAIENLRNDSMRFAIQTLLFSVGPSLPLQFLDQTVVFRLYVVIGLALAIGLWTAIDRRRLLREVHVLIDRAEKVGQ